MANKKESSQNRLQRMNPASAAAVRVDVIERLIRECVSDANAARDSNSWQAVNSFTRLERQLHIDLHDARALARQEAEAAEAAAMAARPDAELLGSIVGALRAMPADARAQVLEALHGPVPLRVVKAAEG